MFAIALLFCSLNSTVTATLAGAVEMRLPPLGAPPRDPAIVPAAAVTLFYGESKTAKLLVLTQVILSLQLPFAVVPLVQFTASRAKMGSGPKVADTEAVAIDRR